MAQNSNGRLWFEAGIDRSQLSKGVTAIHKDFTGLRTDAERTGSAFSDMWRTAALGVGAYLTATAALDMGKQIVNLTRQRELMEKSFEVMLGGADAAAQKIQEINEYAIFSPYTFDGVAKGVQTMSAFGVATEDLMPTLRMLGDVAAGSEERFAGLSYAYGQIIANGRLMTEENNMLAGRGFNPLLIISEKTGKSVAQLRKEMEEGAISVEMVEDAFKTATSEGGKFYGMTAKMADSIEAAKSTFESAWVEKQIEWGKAAQDNIKTMYEFGTSVVENADEIAKVFGVLIATVGAYKAALIAMSVTQKVVGAIEYSGQIAGMRALLTATQQVTNADLVAAVAKGKLSAAAAENIAAIRAEVAAKLSSLQATAQVAAGEANAAKAAVVAANAKANAARASFQAASQELAVAKASGVQKDIDTAATNRQTAARNLRTAATAKANAVEALATAQTKAQTAATAASAFATKADTVTTLAAANAKNLFALASAKVVAGLRAIKVAFMSNPLGFLITALTTAVSAMYLFSDSTEAANAELSKTEQIAKDYGDQLLAEQAKVKRLSDTVRDSVLPMQQRLDAIKELKKIIPEYNAEISKEGGIIRDNTQAIEDYLKAKEKEIKSKIYEAQLQELYTQQIAQQKTLEAAEAAPMGDAADNAQYAEFLEQQSQNRILIARAALQKTNKEIAKINADISAGFSEGGATTTVTTLTDAQKKAIQAEADARRKMYEQGLLDYETFQQGVERLAQEHAERVAAYETQTADPATLAQLSEGSKAQMDAEIEALHEKHKTARFLALEAARKQVEINNDRIAQEWETEQEAFERQQELQARLLEDYATYEQKRAAITAQYEAEKAAMYTDEGQSTFAAGFDQGNVDNLTNAYEVDLQDLDVETARSLGVLGDLWGNFANVASTEIDKIIAANERLYTLLSGGAEFTPEIGAEFGITSEMFESLKNVEDLAEFRKRLDALKDEAKESKTYFEGLAASWKQMIDGAKEGDFESFEAGLQGVTSKAQSAVEMLDMLTEAVGAVGGNTEGLEKVSGALSGAASGAAAGAALGPWGAAAGAALGLIQSGFSAAAAVEAEHQKILAEIEEAQRNYELAYDEFKRTLALSGGADTQVLGSFEYDEAIRGVQAYREEMERLYDLVNESEYAEVKAAGVDWSQGLVGLIAYAEALDSAKKGLYDLEVVTGSYTTGALWWKERHDVTEKLVDVYPDLIDAQGNFNAEVGRTILETANMDDATREAFENMVLSAEAAEEAMAQLRESLSSMFGDIGNSMGDAIADAFINGKDVGLAALDELEGGLQSFATEMAKSMAFGDLMEKASEEMLEAWKIEDEEKRNAEIMRIFGDLAADSEQAAEDQAEIMQMLKDAAEKEGLDIFEPEDATQGQADASAITAIQEEAPGSIDGKLTALQITSSQTAVNTTLLVAGQAQTRMYVLELRDGMDMLNLNTRRIYDETKLIREYASTLPAMATDIKKVVTNTAKL